MNEPNYFIPKRSFEIFGIDIYYYAVMIIIGVLLAVVAVSLLFKRRNIPVSWVLDLLLCVLPLGIIGARTFSVLTDPGSSITEWFSGFRSGGLSITGGIIGGALGVVLFCIIHKINFLRVADCLLPGVILAQAMGRWGNFFNQEVYGGLVTDPSMQWFPFAVYIENGGEWHYAFFFYEMLANLVIFALLFTLMWKFNKRPHGLSMCGYFFGYGLVRSIMEPLRDPQFQLGHTVMISEVFAIIMCAGGFLLAVILIGWNKYKHGSFFGSKNSEPLAVMPVYYTKDRLKKMAEENKLTEARILQAGGAPALPKEEKPLVLGTWKDSAVLTEIEEDPPREQAAENASAPPAEGAPKEKKSFSERVQGWRTELKAWAKEFFRPYSPEDGAGSEPPAGSTEPAEGAESAAPSAQEQDGNGPDGGEEA